MIWLGNGVVNKHETKKTKKPLGMVFLFKCINIKKKLLTNLSSKCLVLKPM